MILIFLFLNLCLSNISIQAGNIFGKSTPVLLSDNEVPNYFDLLDAPLIDLIRNHLSLKEQWNTFDAFPRNFPCPSKFVYNYNDELEDKIQNEFKWIEENSQEFIRKLFCASDVSITYDVYYHKDEILFNTIIRKLRKKYAQERKANTIKTLRIKADIIVFRKLLHFLPIDVNSLEHLDIELYGWYKDGPIPMPILQSTNQLKSIRISYIQGLAWSKELSHMIQHLLSHSQHLQHISIDCLFLYSLSSINTSQVNKEWKKVVKNISNLSSISIQICDDQMSHVNNYDFYTVLLKNQASSLKELKLLTENRNNADDLHLMSLKVKDAIKEYTKLERIELNGFNLNEQNEAHLMLLNNNRHLKHLVIKKRFFGQLKRNISAGYLMDWKEKMKQLKALESLKINTSSSGLHYAPIEFFINIVEGIKDTSSLKELTLLWEYNEVHNATALVKLIEGIKSLKKIHLPDALGINRN